VKPTTAALAPSEPRNGPMMPRAPSVGHVGKQLDDANDQDEPERQLLDVGFLKIHFITDAVSEGRAMRAAGKQFGSGL
jgi:hypothetical protein